MNKLDDKKLRFYEKAHTYWYGKQKLQSVTQFVHSFFEPFKAREIARKLAKFPVNKRRRMGVRFFLQKWADSASHGTKVHKEIEDFINGSIGTIGEEIEPKTEQAIDFITEYLLTNKIVKGRTEQKVFSAELGLAGTIDWMTVFEDGSFDLIDWKTNEKLTSEGYKGKKGIHEVTKEVDDCHLTKYGLQLSMYAYILEKYYGLKCRNLIIVHLKEDEYHDIVVPYEKELVEEMLK